MLLITLKVRVTNNDCMEKDTEGITLYETIRNRQIVCLLLHNENRGIGEPCVDWKD